MDRLRSDHEEAQKDVRAADKTIFDLDAAEKEALDLLADDDDQFVWGVSYASSTSIKTMNMMVEVDQNDGCHMHSETQGVMLNTVTIDSNHHIVPVAVSIFIDNERGGTWNPHNDFIVDTYGDDYDSPRRRRIIDLLKGLIASMTSHLSRGLLMACYKHRSEHVGRTTIGGKLGAAFYREAVYAATVDQARDSLNHEP